MTKPTHSPVVTPDPVMNRLLGRGGSTYFRTRWVEACEVCGGAFGETTGEVGDKLACASCVSADRLLRFRGASAAAALKARRKK